MGLSCRQRAWLAGGGTCRGDAGGRVAVEAAVCAPVWPRECRTAHLNDSDELDSRT